MIFFLADPDPEKNFWIAFNGKMWGLQWELVEGVNFQDQ